MILSPRIGRIGRSSEARQTVAADCTQKTSLNLFLCSQHEKEKQNPVFGELWQTIQGFAGAMPGPGLRQLSPDLIGRLWPSARVVGGMRVCKFVREALLLNAREVVFQTATTMCCDDIGGGDVDQELLCADLARFKGTVALDLRVQNGSRHFLNALERTSELGRLHAVVSLSLSSSVLGVDGAKSLSSVLSRCPALRNLDLRENRIDGEAAGHLAQGLQHCSMLEKIDMSRNALGDEGAIAVSEALLCCKSLKNICINWNEIGDSGAGKLALVVHQCRSTLNMVDLHCNKITDSGMQLLAAGLGQCYFLSSIDLSQNAFSAKSATCLAAALAHLKLLRSVNLHSNNIGEEGGLCVARAVRQWKRLKHLSMARMQLGPRGTSAVVDALSACKHLESLDLSENGIGDVEDGSELSCPPQKSARAQALALSLGRCSKLMAGAKDENGVGAQRVAAHAHPPRECSSSTSHAPRLHPVASRGGG